MPCPPLGGLLNPGIKTKSPTLHVDSLPSEPPAKPMQSHYFILKKKKKQLLTVEPDNCRPVTKRGGHFSTVLRSHPSSAGYELHELHASAAKHRYPPPNLTSSEAFFSKWFSSCACLTPANPLEGSIGSRKGPLRSCYSNQKVNICFPGFIF